MIEMGKENGVAVAALVGAKEHAVKQAEAGVDILVVSAAKPVTLRRGFDPGAGTEVEAVKPRRHSHPRCRWHHHRSKPACMSMGAHGAWTGSMWLTTTEAFTSQVIRKILQATSRQTVRSRSRTGKHSRQLRSPWTDAWESEAHPPLPRHCRHWFQSQRSEN